MWSKIKVRIFPILIALTALSISASAALFSVIGLTQLFAGIGIAVVVMASSLEVAKLVIASVLYQFRKTLSKLLKFYLTSALIVLMVITSAGIYGYLSQGYSVTANKMNVIEQQISSLETKKSLYINNKQELLKEKESISKSISELRSALSTGTILQSRDKEGNLITKESKSNRKSYESQLLITFQEDKRITNDLNEVNDSIFSYENKILKIKSEFTNNTELGPLKYISTLTEQPMDKVINWFILVIIFVFDPLAISLVIAANFAFERLKIKNYEGVYPNEEKFDIGNNEQYEKLLPNPNIPIKTKNTEQELDKSKLQNQINQLENYLNNSPSLSTRKRYEIEQHIKELNKQLNDPYYVPTTNKEY